MTMLAIKEKLARAKSDYKDALDRLGNVHETYKISGGAYARALERQKTLNAKIAGAETDFDNANQLIKRLLEKNHFVKTEAVKSAMLEKYEAESIKAELQLVLQADEIPTLKLKLDASLDARLYETVFMGAQDAHARLQVFEALASCGPELSRAMALMSHVGAGQAGENVVGDESELRERRVAFVWQALKEMAAARSENFKRPHVIEIGMLEMGPFADRNFIPPIEASRLRKMIEDGKAIE